MFVRLLAVAAMALLVACDEGAPAGPLHTDSNAFAYVATVANGMPIYVRNGRGAIEVEPSPDDSLRVSAELSWRGSAERPSGVVLSAAGLPRGTIICAEFGGGECSIDNYTMKSKGFDIFGRRDVKVRFRIQVPAGLHLDLTGIDTRIVSASTAPVKARTMNGDVTVVTSVGPVRAETVNGDVDARMTTLSGSDTVVAKTLNGDAWAYLPEMAAVTLDVTTKNGRVDTDFPALASVEHRKSIVGGLHGGGTPVVVRTFNGRAGVRRLDAEGRSYPKP